MTRTSDKKFLQDLNEWMDEYKRNPPKDEIKEPEDKGDYLDDHRRQNQSDSFKIIAVSALFFFGCCVVYGIIELVKYLA